MKAVLKRLVGGTAAALLLALPGAAQSPVAALYQKMRQAAAGDALRYRYEVTIFEDGKPVPVDRLEGSLVKVGASFIDSNKTQIRVRDGGEYLQIDCRKQTAYYGDIARLSRKHRLNPNLIEAFRVPDSVLFRTASMRVDSVSDPAHFVVTIDLRKAETLVEFVRLWVDKRSFATSRLQYEYALDDAVLTVKHQYRYRFDLFDIAPAAAGQKPDIRTYLADPGKKSARLRGNYAAYTLIPIL